MSTVGNNGDDSSPIDLHAGFSPAKTSSLEFIQELQNFLVQNQIDFIGPFRIQIEITINNDRRLVVVGDTHKSDWNDPDQLDVDLACPSISSLLDETPSDGTSISLPDIISSFPASLNVSSPEWDIHVPGNYWENRLTQLQYLQLDGNTIDCLAAFELMCPPDFISASIPSVHSKSLPIGTDHSLSSPLFNSLSSIVVDNQNTLAIDTTHDLSLAACNAYTSPIFGMGSTIEISHITTPWQVDSIAPQSTTTLGNHRRKRKRSSASSDDLSELMIESLSQNILSDDFYHFLESELPRWIQDGLQHDMPTQTKHSEPHPSSSMSTPAPSLSSFLKLEQAYLAVCQLNSRMSGDLVYSRIALIKLHVEYSETHQSRRRSLAGNRIESTVGRGHASHVIDLILENIHEGWRTLDQRTRTELRAKFHDQKKYGKRWSELANALGPGILLICSSKLANAVRSATASAKMLDAVIKRVKVTDSDALKILGVINPLAGCLVKNEDFRQFEAARILRQLYHYPRRLR